MKDIIRFYKSGRKHLVLRGVTEKQAQEWCSSRYTRKEGKWFDGFVSTGTMCLDKQPFYTSYVQLDKNN